MTYNVFGGTLNPTLLLLLWKIHRVPRTFFLSWKTENFVQNVMVVRSFTFMVFFWLCMSLFAQYFPIYIFLSKEGIGTFCMLCDIYTVLVGSECCEFMLCAIVCFSCDYVPSQLPSQVSRHASVCIKRLLL